MKLIVDGNVLFSALIKEGVTRKLLSKFEFDLYSPNFILEEFLKHLSELENKTKVDGELLKQKIEELIKLASIKVIHSEELKDYISEAEKITPDPNDILYFALALKLNCPLWSNDKKLKEQNKIKVYSTEDLIKQFDI